MDPPWPSLLWFPPDVLVRKPWNLLAWKPKGESNHGHKVKKGNLRRAFVIETEEVCNYFIRCKRCTVGWTQGEVWLWTRSYVQVRALEKKGRRAFCHLEFILSTQSTQHAGCCWDSSSPQEKRGQERHFGDELCTEPEAGEAACVSHTYSSLHWPHNRLQACVQPMHVAALQTPDVNFNFKTRSSGLTQLQQHLQLTQEGKICLTPSQVSLLPHTAFSLWPRQERMEGQQDKARPWEEAGTERATCLQEGRGSSSRVPSPAPLRFEAVSEERRAHG